MATVTDERVVEMRIDNQRFEAGAKKTIGILESLDRSLHGLSKQNADGFEGVAESLDKVTDKFSVLGTIGDQVIRNITSSVMNMVGDVQRMVNSLTFDQIGAGWSKYADKTSAVQTIMAATHKDVGNGKRWADEAEQMEYVNEQLERLNWFTDETSYNFLDMVGNIGKFTAAGRELEESVTAMEGIATWAAISGGRTEEASRAMYNLSQALGMGYVGQMDWKSIENANMATYEFKEMAIAAAEAQGMLKKVGDGIWQTTELAKKAGKEVTVESFRTELSSQWFTSDVLLDTLQTYGSFTDGLSEALDKLKASGADFYATNFLSAMEAYEKGLESKEWQKITRGLTAEQISILTSEIEKLSAAEYDMGRRAFQAAQEAKTFQEAINATKDAVSTKWMNVFEKIFGDYLHAKGLWTELSEMLYSVFANPLDKILEIAQSALDLPIFEALEDGTVIRHAAEDIHELQDSAEGFTGPLAATGRTLEDLKKALKEVNSEKFDAVTKQYNSLDEAIKAGAVDAEWFKQAMESMSKQTEGVGGAAEVATQSLEKLREVAMGVLRGDYGNGEERKKKLEELGYDYEMIQAIAGQIQGFKNLYDSYDISDEQLIEWMERYYDFNNLTERLGAKSFTEWLNGVGASGSILKYSEEQIAAMNAALADSEYLYNAVKDGAMSLEDAFAIISGSTPEELAKYKTGGELLRETFTNLIDFFNNLSESFSQAFDDVFGTTDVIGERFHGVIYMFWQFSDALNSIDFTKVTKALTGPLAFIKLIGKAITTAFNILRKAISLIFKILSPLQPYLALIFDYIGAVFDLINSFSLENFEKTVTEIENKLRDLLAAHPRIQAFVDTILEALNLIGTAILGVFGGAFATACTVVSSFVDLIQNGIEVNGFTGAIDNIKEKLNEFLVDHPALQNLYTTIKSFIDPVYKWVSTVFTKIGNVVKRVSGYVQEGFLEGGLQGAVKALFDSVQRGFRRIVPTGDAILNFLSNIKNYFSSNAGGIVNLISNALNTISGFISSIWNAIFKKDSSSSSNNNFVSRFVSDASKASDEATGVIEPLRELTDAANDAVRAVGDVADATMGESVPFQQRISNFIHNLAIGFLEGLRQVRIKDVISISWLAVIASNLLHIRKTLDDVIDIPALIGDLFKETANTIAQIGRSFQANTVLKLAIAVGILVLAISKIAKLTETVGEDKITYAAAVVGAILVLLTQFMKVSQRADMLKSVNIRNFQVIPELGAALVGLGVFVAAFAFAVSKFNNIGDAKKIMELASPIFMALAVIAFIAITLTKLVKDNSYKNMNSLGASIGRIGLGMVGLALAVQMLTVPIILIAAIAHKMNDYTALGVAAGGIVALLVVMGLFINGVIKAITKVSADPDAILNIGKSIARIALGMVLMVVAIRMLITPIISILATMSILSRETDASGVVANNYAAMIFKLIGAIGVIGILISMLVISMTSIIKSLNKMQNPEAIKQAGTAILKMSVGILLIVSAVRRLIVPVITLSALAAKIGPSKVLTGVASIVAILGALIGLLAVVLHFGKGADGEGKLLKNFGSMLLKIGAGALLFAAAIWILVPALSSLVGVLLAFGPAISTSTDIVKVLWTFAGLAAVLLGFGLAAFFFGRGLISAGLAFIVFAAGLWVMDKAMAGLKTSLPEFLDIIPSIWEKLKDPKVLIAIAGLTTALIAFGLAMRGIIGFFKLLMGRNGVGSLGKTLDTFGKNAGKFSSNIATIIGKAIGSILKAIPKYGKKVFGSIISYLKNNKTAVLNIVITLIGLIGGYITDVIPTLTETIAQAIITLLNSVAATIATHKNEIESALMSIIGQILSVIGGLWKKLKGEITGKDGRSYFDEDALSGLKLLTTLSIGSSFIDSLGKIAGFWNELKSGNSNLLTALSHLAGKTVTFDLNGKKTEEAAGGSKTTTERIKDKVETNIISKIFNKFGLGKKKDISASVSVTATNATITITGNATTIGGKGLPNLGGDGKEIIVPPKVGNGPRPEALPGAGAAGAGGAAAGADVGIKGFLAAFGPELAAGAILIASFAMAKWGVDEQQKFLMNEAEAEIPDDTDLIHRKIEAYNNLVKSVDEVQKEYDELALYAPDTLWAKSEEVDARAIAKNTGLKEFKEALNDTYNLNTNALISDLKKAKDEMKAANNEYNSARKEFSNTYGEAETKEFFDKNSAEAINRAAAIEEYNNALSVLADHLGLSTDELTRQALAVNWDLSQMDALKDQVLFTGKVFEENADGTIKLTEAAEFYIWKMNQAALSTAENSQASTDIIDTTVEEASNAATELGDITGEVATKRDELISMLSLDENQEFLDSQFGVSGFGSGLLNALKNNMLNESEISGLHDELKGLMASVSAGAPEGVDLGMNSSDIWGQASETMLGWFQSLIGDARGPNGLDENSPSHVFEDIGKGIPEGVELGVKDSEGVALSAVTSMLQKIKTPFNSLKAQMSRNGMFTVSGLILGINSGIQAAYNAGVRLANAVNRGYRSTLKIKSPSRVFEELSEYIPLGAAQGIENTTGAAVDSVVVLGNELISAMDRSMAQVGLLAQDNFTVQPRIAPVLDTGSYREMESLLSNSYVRNIESKGNTISNTIDYSLNNHEILDEIQLLAGQVGQLEETMANMQIYLDTGALVGGMSMKMDNQLGRIAARRSRGN